MKKTTVLSAILATMVFSHSAEAQGKFNFRLGGSFPLGEFAEDDINNDEAGGAAPGFAAGMTYLLPLPSIEAGKELDLSLGIDLHYSGLQDDVQDDLRRDYISSTGLFIVELDYWQYFNIPLTIGLHYGYQSSKGFGTFLDAGLSFNILRLSEYKVTTGFFTTTMKFDQGTSLGIKIGGGLSLNEHMSVGLHYYGLGQPSSDYRITNNINFDLTEGTVKQRVKIVALTLGVTF